MSEEHAAATVDNAQKDYGDLSILNCTKVVRLFLLDPENGRTEKFIRENENPTRADIFVDRNKLTLEGPNAGKELVAWSIGLSEVVPHAIAHQQHDRSIL